MSDDDNDDDNLFADSDDTAELIANSKSSSAPARPAATKKKAAAPSKPKKQHSDKPDADNDSDDEDDKGLFDSDSEDGEPATKKKKTATASKPVKKVMSKRERLEALANKHRKDEPNDQSSKRKERSRDNSKIDSSVKDKKNKDDKGYDSGDSYDSGEFQRTADDDDFIDTTGEDADAVNELYAEQHFGDERHDGMETKKKKKREVRYDSDDPDKVSGGGNPDVEPDNPIMAAVFRMKKKKVVKKGISEMEDDVKIFLARMEMVAEEDEQLVSEKKPAMKKLAMLNEVCDMLTKRNMQRMLLDFDLLSVCKRWIQPLPNGTLGNVTVRQRLTEVIGNMTGDTGIVASDLKRSEFGKVVMTLFKHRHETPGMKRQLKILIEQWSRPIFQKSGNMRDLERVTRGDTGLAALSRQHFMTEQRAAKLLSNPSGDGGSSTMASKGRTRNSDELNAMIAGNASGSKKLEAGVNRVRVPYSKGFAFQVRPMGRSTSSTAAEETHKRSKSAGSANDTRNKLSKRMTEKNRLPGKNQRSHNISVEGRVTK